MSTPPVTLTATPTATPEPTKVAPTGCRPSQGGTPPTAAPPLGPPRGGHGFAGAGRSGGQAVTTVAQAEAEVAKAKTALRSARDALAGVTIKAPVAGTILTLAGTAGSTATAGAAFLTLGNLDELQVKAMFSQTDVGVLKLGQRASVSLATRLGARYEGTVTHIDVTATTTGRLVQYGVLIAFDPQPKGLMLGQSATVQVTVAEAGDAVYVPAQAVRTGPGGTATVQVRDGSTTVRRPVEVGVRGDRYVEIRSGLTEGDQIELPASTTSGGFPDEGFPAAP